MELQMELYVTPTTLSIKMTNKFITEAVKDVAKEAIVSCGSIA